MGKRTIAMAAVLAAACWAPAGAAEPDSARDLAREASVRLAQSPGAAQGLYLSAARDALSVGDTAKMAGIVVAALDTMEALSMHKEAAELVLCLAPEAESLPGVLQIRFEKARGASLWRTRDIAGARASFLRLRDLAREHNDAASEGWAMNSLGVLLGEAGQFDSALTAHRMALDVYTQARDPREVSATYNLIGNACLRVNKLSPAERNYQRSIEVAREAGDSAAVARALNNIAKVHRQQGEPDRAIANLNEALAIRESLGEISNCAVVLSEIGSTYWSQDNYSKALEHYQLALRMRRSLADLAQTAATLNNIGTIYKEINMAETALEYYEEALAISQSLKNEALVARCLNFIGGIYYQRGQYDHALDYYLSALGYYELIDDRIARANVYKNIAMMYKNLRNFDMSLEYYQRSLDLYSELTDYKSCADLYGFIGNLYMSDGDLAKARLYLERGRSVRSELRDLPGLARSRSDLAELEQRAGNTDRAIQLLAQIWDGRGVALGYALMTDIARRLSTLYEIRGDNSRALAFARHAEAYKDSLLNQNLLNRVAEVRTQTEAERLYMVQEMEKEKSEARMEAMLQEQRAREAVLESESARARAMRNFFMSAALIMLAATALLLHQKRRAQRINQQLMEANQAVNLANIKLIESEERAKQSDKTKEKMLSIVAHDLRGPFAGFLNLFDIMKGETDEAVRDEILTDVGRSALSIFNLLENLLGWSRAQSEKIAYKPVRVSPRRLVDEVAELYRMRVTEKEIDLRNNLPDELEVLCDRSMLAFVFRNLVNNAIKFVPRGGRISVGHYLDSGQHHFMVSDNGVGIPEENLRLIFSPGPAITTLGLEREKGTGLGLRMCKEFVDCWQGRIEAASSASKGTVIDFSIPAGDDPAPHANS